MLRAKESESKPAKLGPRTALTGPLVGVSGMKSVLNCTQTGLFHPHAESNIYTDALRPGHVHEAKGLEFEVVDLRPKCSR